MAEKPLILVTRTRPAARHLVDRIEALGLQALECAPFQLEPPEDPDTVADDLATALPADRVILTSQEAARQAVALVGAGPLNRSLVIVPGEGTAAIARELGLGSVFFPERHGTSEAMLTMPELRKVDGLDILILAAAGGRGLIGEVLERRGATVEKIHVYRRVACELPADTASKIRAAGSLVTLGASLEAVSELVAGLPGKAAERLFKHPLIVPSRRIAERALQLGFEDCHVATGASDKAMLAELSRLT